MYKKKYEEFKLANHYSEVREVVSIGSKIKCNYKIVDAEEYFEKKLE
jgi:hypothetical protein